MFSKSCHYKMHTFIISTLLITIVHPTVSTICKSSDSDPDTIIIGNLQSPFNSLQINLNITSFASTIIIDTCFPSIHVSPITIHLHNQYMTQLTSASANNPFSGCSSLYSNSAKIVHGQIVNLPIGQYIIYISSPSPTPFKMHIYCPTERTLSDEQLEITRRRMQMGDPTCEPTMDPTVPTFDPTPEPTVPTNEPTMEPTADPTFDPTIDPTQNPTPFCPDCPFNITLANISAVSLIDCPRKPTKAPVHKWHKRSSSSSRRRRLNWYRSGSWSGSESDSDGVSISDSDSDSDDDDRKRNKRCLAPDGDKLIFVDDLCKDDGYHHRSDDHRHRDPKKDGFLAPVCVTYNFEEFSDGMIDCGEVKNIFLGLCENEDTDFDIDKLGVQDVTNIISDDTFDDDNNVLDAFGSRQNGQLGVNVILETNDDFTICFENVTVTTSFNQTKDDLETGSGFINFTDFNGDVQQCNVTGLPCLNFFFGCDDDLIGPEQEANIISPGILIHGLNCDCDKGIKVLSLEYVGADTAASIIGYHNKRGTQRLCEFNNVEPGDVITCNVYDAGYESFRKRTHFGITYNDNQRRRRRQLLNNNDRYEDSQIMADCIGGIRTDCGTQIIGDILEYCNDLMIVSYIDDEDAFCDESVLKISANSRNNALINGKERNENPFKLFKKLDPYIQYMLIGILLTFGMLIIASIYICFGRHKLNKKDEQEIDVIAQEIALTKKQNEEQKKVDLKQRKQNNLHKGADKVLDETHDTTTLNDGTEQNPLPPSLQTYGPIDYDLNVEDVYFLDNQAMDVIEFEQSDQQSDSTRFED